MISPPILPILAISILFIGQFTATEGNNSDRFNALKRKKSDAKLSGRLRIKELRCMKELMERNTQKWTLAPMAETPPQYLIEPASATSSPAPSPLRTTVPTLALENNDFQPTERPLMESLQIKRLDKKNTEKNSAYEGQKDDEERGYASTSTNSLGVSATPAAAISLSPSSSSMTTHQQIRENHFPPPPSKTTTMPSTSSTVLQKQQILAIPAASPPPPPPAGDPLQMTWENCRKMENYAKMFGVPNPREWVRDNCLFIQLYVHAPCADINQFVASCANFGQHNKPNATN